MKQANHFYFLLLCCSFLQLKAQNLTLLWDANFNGNGAVKTIVVNHEVNVFAVNYDEYKSYLLKYDESGNRLDSVFLPFIKSIGSAYFSTKDSTFLLEGYTFQLDSAIIAKCTMEGDMVWAKTLGIDGYETFIPLNITQNSKGQIAAGVNMTTVSASLSHTGYLLLSETGELEDVVNFKDIISPVNRDRATCVFLNDTTLIVGDQNSAIDGFEFFSFDIKNKKLNWSYQYSATSLIRYLEKVVVTNQNTILFGGTFNSIIELGADGKQLSEITVNENPDYIHVTTAIQERDHDYLEISYSQDLNSSSTYLITFTSFTKDLKTVNWTEDYCFQGCEYAPAIGDISMTDDSTLYTVILNLALDDGHYVTKFHIAPSKSVATIPEPVEPFPASIEPNPTADGHLWIRSPEWPAMVEIIDAAGRLVFRELAGADIEIRLPAPGFYTVRLTDGLRSRCLKAVFAR